MRRAMFLAGWRLRPMAVPVENLVRAEASVLMLLRGVMRLTTAALEQTAEVEGLHRN